MDHDRIFETSTSTGTGPFNLAGNKTGYQRFISTNTHKSGERARYCIENLSLGEWEVGVGIVSGTGTLTRIKVQSSSNDGALVNFSTGTKNVFSVPGADVSNRSVNDPDPDAFAIFIGDSLTHGGQQGRAPGIFDGRTWYTNTSITTPSNIGNANWIVYALMDGRAGTNGGTLNTDGTGRMRWTCTSDAAGPYIDVSQGGWFYLPSGTAEKGILVAVRGATAPVTNATSGVTNSGGLPTTADYNLLGYVAWVAGGLGDTFADYRAYGIHGSNTADMVKFAPQALASYPEIVCIMAGVNDNPGSSAAAASSILNMKTLIDMARVKARYVYVMSIAPNPSASTTINGFLVLVSEAVRLYCSGLPNVRFVNQYERLVAPSASSVGGNAGGKTGVFFDQLHFMPYGAYLCADPLVEMIRRDYPHAVDRSTVGQWDSTLQIGALNANPTLRGTAGTATGPRLTGTAPDGWTVSASGSTQTCTTTFEAADDGGIDWFTLSVASATANDFHEVGQIFTLPSGVVTGDYIQVVVECQITEVTGAGLAMLSAQVNGNNNVQSVYLLSAGRDIANLGSRKPILHMRSEPQKLVTGTPSVNMRLRVGAKTGGGTAKVGFRRFRIEKCAAPLPA